MLPVIFKTLFAVALAPACDHLHSDRQDEKGTAGLLRMCRMDRGLSAQHVRDHAG